MPNQPLTADLCPCCEQPFIRAFLKEANDHLFAFYVHYEHGIEYGGCIMDAK